MQQNATDWTPTPKQAKMLQCAQEDGLNRNITALCREAGIAPSTFYRWLQRSPGFKAAWEEVWRGSIRRHLPGVVAATIAKALDGNIQAARLITDLAAATKSGHEVNVTQTTYVPSERSRAEARKSIEEQIEEYAEVYKRVAARQAAAEAAESPTRRF